MPRPTSLTTLRWPAALLLAPAAPAVHCAPMDFPLGPLPIVEIVGIAPQSAAAIERDRLPYAVQRATDKDITQARADNLADYLSRHVAGINVNDISGSPFQTDLTYRGYRASPVLGSGQGLSVYLDGVRVNEPFGDVINWDMVPEAAIGAVLLVPGSNPLYGLNTLGGALALTTKSGRSHPGLMAEVTVGSGARKRVDISYGVAAQEWHTLVAATAFDEDGWRDHSDGHLGNVFVKVGRVSGGTDWNVSLLGGRSRLLGNGLLPSGSADAPGLYELDRRAVYTYPDRTRNQLGQVTFNLRQQLGEGAELTATAYVRHSRRDTVNGDVNDDAFEAEEDEEEQEEEKAVHPAILNTTSARQHAEGASVQLSATRGPHQLSAGVSLDRNRVRYAQFEQEGFFSDERGVLPDPDEEREPSSSVTGSARTAGVYVSDTWTAAPGTFVTLSARYTHARVANTLTNDAGEQPRETFTYRKLNPSLGIAHQVDAGLTLFANLAQSNRVPTVIELGCADPAQPCRLPVGLQADPYLAQVVSRTVEAGARWQAGMAALTLSLYRTRNRDDILFLSASASQQGYFANFERTLHQGLDVAARTDWAGPWGNVGARASYSWLQAEYDADGELFTGARNVHVTRGTRLAGLPRHTFKLGVDWAPAAGWSVGADMVAVSNLLTQGNEDGLAADPEEGVAPRPADWRIGGHALLHLRASWQPAPRWELFVRVNNALDRRHESYGTVARDVFPGGQPLAAGEEAQPARFVAPGAPRTWLAGLRYRF
ncbi:outer membrane receptor protein involved in Fe transport [Pseudoduganella flava]|uniref:Outer membrane receptor protein involved in Fe transport n=1 Tax=Pseudoduganella flava TaxID=871742 RepID=A0A562PK48_9BURK|nr:TonB-dependent receptor [Pseudoduganella flava]TWI44396.1 outer membrane receptor protein involved in Fe transport [Pseudoduganella flava]